MKQFIAQHAIHWLASGTATAFLMAALRNMPPPAAGSVWYKWLYDTVQTLMEKPKAS